MRSLQCLKKHTTGMFIYAVCNVHLRTILSNEETFDNISEL